MGVYDDLLAAPSAEAVQPLGQGPPRQPAPTGNVYSDMLAAPPPAPVVTPKSDVTWNDTINDFGRAVTNAATFGMGNRAKAYIESMKSGGDYSAALENQVKASEVARERNPAASIAGDVYGSFAIPALGAEALALRTGAALAPTIGRAAPAVGRAVGYGTTGAITGAAQGAGSTYSGNAPDYVKNALIGGAISAPLGAVGGAAFGRGPARTSARTPDAAELEAAKNIAYRSLEQHPAQYTPQSFASQADVAEAALRARNAHKLTSPQAFRTVEQMRAPPTMTAAGRPHVSPADIDFVRKGVTGDQIAGATPTDQASAGVVRRAIDDYLRNPPAGAAMPGTAHLATDASRIANTAHQLHGGFRRTQALEELISNAERQAGATYSGLNLRNELQKAVKSSLKERKGQSAFSKAGYNDAELAAFDQFARGQGVISRGLGYADKYLGGGGGLGALAATGVGGGLAGQYFKDTPGVGAAFGLGATGLGLGLRMIGNRRAAGNIRELSELIAQRNPLYQARVARAPMVPGRGSPATAEALRDALTTTILRARSQSPEEE